MRMLDGTSLIEAPPAWREEVLAKYRRVIVDVGAGDGRWAYERARTEPSTLFVALDPDADSMRAYAYRASRKPSRGGVPNAVFVVASAEDAPPELAGAAGHVHVGFPWAALLRGLLEAEPRVLGGLRRLGSEGATFEIVLTYDASHDRGAGLPQSLPTIDAVALRRLRRPYAALGLVVESIAPLSREEALAIPSSWGRRLLHGRQRQVWRLSGRMDGGA